MNIKRIIREELLREQLLCTLVSPKGHGEDGYMSNGEALSLINRIQTSAGEIKDPRKAAMFKQTLSQFRHDITNADTNNDNVDTYLHKLRDLVGCYGLSNRDNTNPEDFDF
jgi:hypothetical protein